jgi:hypothetical protein
MTQAISRGQLKRLQVLYSQYAKQEILTNTREERLRWASLQVGHEVSSFSNLQLREAKTLIDHLQSFLRIKQTRRPARPMSRRSAEKAATEGRHDQKHAEQTIAAAADLARIQHGMDLLGWDESRLEAWLRSSHSPLARKVNGARVAPADPQIRTLGDANRVWWALKRMAQLQGVWKPQERYGRAS